MIEVNKIGLIAGNGDLPLQIVDECKKNNVEIAVVLIKGFANKNDYKNVKNLIELPFTSIGKIFKFLKNNNVKHIAFAGAVKKPSFNIFTLDFKALQLLKKILQNKFLGDNSVLNTIINFANVNGFDVLEIDKILSNVKFEKGFNSNVDFNHNYEFEKDIELGKNTLEKLSNLDIGQSIVIQQQNVIGIECVEGTKELINRCGQLQYKKGRKAILVKMKKVGQNRKIDLPTIGPDTIEQLHNNDFAGIAIDYENCLVVSINKVIELSNKYNIFIYGI